MTDSPENVVREALDEGLHCHHDDCEVQRIKSRALIALDKLIAERERLRVWGDDMEAQRDELAAGRDQLDEAVRDALDFATGWYGRGSIDTPEQKLEGIAVTLRAALSHPEGSTDV